MPDEEALLELEHVAKRYEAMGGADAPWVLKEVSLRVAPGESLAIVGPSGSGKSTLLNIIGTLDRPTEGRVLLEGKDLATLGDAELAALRNRDIGFVFQLHHLLPQCTVLENVLIPTLARTRRGAGVAATGSVAGLSDKGAACRHAERGRCQETRDRARTLLERVGLGERLSYRPGHLSGGERQRAAVVRALINRPRLLLADEPTGSLDRDSADHLGQLLVELNREQGVTLIVVTHSQDLASLMGRVLELRNGHLG